MKDRILLVEDEEDFASVASRLLEAEGFEVVIAGEADSARESIRVQRPDLVVLDVVMPGKDGFSFASELSRSDECRHLPIVLLTCLADNPGALGGAFEADLGQSVKAIVPKSNMVRDLVNAVRRALCCR